MTAVIHLRVPGQLAYRDLATRAVSAACKLVPPNRLERGPSLTDFTNQVVSAVGEAFNNVVLHGYKGLDPGDVCIDITTHTDRLQVRIADYGHSFDPHSVPIPDLDGLPESGMGLFIIRSFMDIVDYQPGQPNVLVLTKLFSKPASFPPNSP
jgi:serine/threonine-protein kinase RsbW